MPRVPITFAFPITFESNHVCFFGRFSELIISPKTASNTSHNGLKPIRQGRLVSSTSEKEVRPQHQKPIVIWLTRLFPRIWRWLHVFSRLLTGFFPRIWHRLHVSRALHRSDFPAHLTMLVCFPAFVTGSVFQRIWHWLLFSRASYRFNFPTFGSSRIFSRGFHQFVFPRICHRLHVFPRNRFLSTDFGTCYSFSRAVCPHLSPVTCFPTLEKSSTKQ